MRSRERRLAVSALVVAAIASAASSEPEDGEGWDLARSVGGPTVQLGTAQTFTIRAELNEAALSEGDSLADQLVVTAHACLGSSSTGDPVRLRAAVIPEAAQGPVMEREAPPCPDTVPLVLRVYGMFSCTTAAPCVSTWDARFERVGAAGTDLRVAWDVVGLVNFWGDDGEPPDGADLTLEVLP